MASNRLAFLPVLYVNWHHLQSLFKIVPCLNWYRDLGTWLDHLLPTIESISPWTRHRDFQRIWGTNSALVFGQSFWMACHSIYSFPRKFWRTRILLANSQKESHNESMAKILEALCARYQTQKTFLSCFWALPRSVSVLRQEALHWTCSIHTYSHYSHPVFSLNPPT